MRAADRLDAGLAAGTLQSRVVLQGDGELGSGIGSRPSGVSEPWDLGGGDVSDSSFRKILVGVDAEGLADHAIAQGARLAEDLGAELELVHAVSIPPVLWPGISPEQLSSMHASALERARNELVPKARDVLRSAGVHQRVEDCLHVRPGHPAKVILSRVREAELQLVLLGPHAKRDVFDFGSTARAVLSSCPCPVWVQVRPAEPIRRILVAVDFSETSRHALETAMALAAQLGASLRVLHSFDPPHFALGLASAELAPEYLFQQEREASEALLTEWVRDADQGAVELESVLSDGLPSATIREQAEAFDLIVLGTHGRTGLARFLVGSVAYSVLKEVERPVVVVRGKQEWLLDDPAD